MQDNSPQKKIILLLLLVSFLDERRCPGNGAGDCVRAANSGSDFLFHELFVSFGQKDGGANRGGLALALALVFFRGKGHRS